MQYQFTSTTESDAPTPVTLPINGASPSVNPAPQKMTYATEEEDSVSAAKVETAIQQWHLAQAKRARRETARRLWALVRLFLLLSACLFTPLMLHLTSDPNLLAGGFITLFGFLLILCLLNAQPKVLKNVEAIAEMEDVRAIGPLLEIRSAASFAEQEVICAALIRTLPRLDTAGANQLSPAQWQALYGCVTNRMSEHRPEFATACLEALERFGNENALPCLTLLVVQDAPTQAMQTVRARANQCLHVITDRLDFGTVQDIPAWVAKLPDPHEAKATVNLPVGVTWTECLTAVFALTRLLPQLTPADAGLLNQEARQRLGISTFASMYALSHGRRDTLEGGVLMSRLGIEYNLARLAAFEQIGTGSDLPFLESCQSLAVTSEDIQKLRARVETVSAILEARREKELTGETLLRGSSAPLPPAHDLLRPAQASSAPTAPDELLRPTTAQERQDKR